MITNVHKEAENPRSPLSPSISHSCLRDGILLLWRTFRLAQDTGMKRCQFAVEIQELYDLQLSTNDLRWLVAKGFVKHAHETSALGDMRRSFQPTNGLTFSEQTVFVLTDSGAMFAARLYAAELQQSDLLTWAEPLLPGESCDATKPIWHAKQRELWLDGALVKRFRVRASNQEMILRVFDEEGWPTHIDDPLPVTKGVDAHTRLHDTIYRLNGCQINERLRFRGNGRADGVFWERIST